MQSVWRMTEGMVHRGPDQRRTVFRTLNICMGMRRLSIIDLEGGRQPLFNEDGSLVLMANGEIYNCLELRGNLVANGHRFKTTVTVRLNFICTKDFGTDCVQHMRGMFAFALWDKRLGRLMLDRDRMGEKPLYYNQDQTRFCSHPN